MTDEKEPRTITEWFERGRQCFNKPDGVAAVKALERVIDLDPVYCHPDGDNPYFYLGKIHEVEGRLEEAIINYSRALAIDSNDEESLIGRGSCYTATRRNSEAIDDFSKVLHFPDQIRRVPKKHILYVIAENYRQLEDWDMALFWGQKALHADPGNQRHQELVKLVQAKSKPSQD
jgi:tetratricopeptide (TPR) repeat protein